MLPIPRQFTSKIPQDPPTPRRDTCQADWLFCPKTVIFWWFLPKFLTYFVPFSSLMVSWAQAFQAHLEPLQQGVPRQLLESQSGKSTVPRQFPLSHDTKPIFKKTRLSEILLVILELVLPSKGLLEPSTPPIHRLRLCHVAQKSQSQAFLWKQPPTKKVISFDGTIGFLFSFLKYVLKTLMWLIMQD